MERHSMLNINLKAEVEEEVPVVSNEFDEDYLTDFESSAAGADLSSPGNENSKIAGLEKAMKIFRAEFDLKMNIIQQILTTRRKEFQVQKKLMEREERMYETLLGHWENAHVLANEGVSISFEETSPNVEDRYEMDATANDFLESSLNVSEFEVSKSPESSQRRCLRMRRKLKRLPPLAEAEVLETLEKSNNDVEDIGYEYEETKGTCGNTEHADRDGDPDYGPEDDHVGSLDEVQTKKSKITHYRKVREFKTEEEGCQFIQSERKWKLKNSRELSEGRKRYYCCKFDRKCLAKICLLHEHSTTGVISIFRNEIPHTHTPRLQLGLPSIVKDKIKALMDLNIRKPGMIIRKLQESKVPPPSVRQLQNFLAAERRRVLGVKNWPRNGIRDIFSKRGRPKKNLSQSNLRPALVSQNVHVVNDPVDLGVDSVARIPDPATPLTLTELLNVDPSICRF